MIKNFRHKGLEKFFITGRPKGLKQQHTRRIRLILGRLHAASIPADMDLPGLHLHQLKGRERSRWSVRVNGNWRITFSFQGREVIDVDYEDYH